MDATLIVSVISCMVSCGGVIGALVKIGIYKGQNDVRVENLEKLTERMQEKIDENESLTNKIDKKLEGLSKELQVSMKFISDELNEIKEEIQNAKAQ